MLYYVNSIRLFENLFFSSNIMCEVYRKSEKLNKNVRIFFHEFFLFCKICNWKQVEAFEVRFNLVSQESHGVTGLQMLKYSINKNRWSSWTPSNEIISKSDKSSGLSSRAKSQQSEVSVESNGKVLRERWASTVPPRSWKRLKLGLPWCSLLSDKGETPRSWKYILYTSLFNFNFVISTYL